MMIGFIADYSTIYNDLNESDRAQIENNLSTQSKILLIYKWICLQQIS